MLFLANLKFHAGNNYESPVSLDKYKFLAELNAR
jgi:hypothetical protein